MAVRAQDCSNSIHDVLACVAGGKSDGFCRWDRDGLARPRIAPPAFGTVSSRKRFEANHLHRIAARHCICHGIKAVTASTIASMAAPVRDLLSPVCGATASMSSCLSISAPH